MKATGVYPRCWLILAMGIAVTNTPALAAEPTVRDYLQMCSIGDSDFGRFADDRQMAGDELEIVRRIVVRLRDCPADSLRRWIAAELGGGNGDPPPAVPSPTDAKEHRGRPARLRGRIESIERVRETDAVTEPLWRCILASDERPHRAIVYLAQIHKGLQVGDSVTVDSVFLKYVPGEREVPVPVFVAARFQRPAAGPLGEMNFDIALFDGIGDKSPMTAADSGAFYRLLELTATADAARLRREASNLDAGAAASLFGDPAARRGPLDARVRDCPPRRTGADRRPGDGRAAGRRPLFRDRPRCRRLARQSLVILHAPAAAGHAPWRPA